MALYYPDLPLPVWAKPYFLLGLSGTIAAGKSSAASFFQEAGAKVVDADLLARESLEQAQIQEQLHKAFGESVFTQSGKTAPEALCRQALARIVFQDKKKRALLNSLIHPYVQKQWKLACNALAKGEILVYDAPLLFEAAAYKNMDWNVMIDAPVQLRYERAKHRNAWSWQDFQSREESQFSSKEKSRRADLVIVNTKGKNDLREAVRHVYSLIQKAFPG